jgi:hypothetical protein
MFLNHQGILSAKVKSSLVWLVSLAVSFAFLSLTFLNFSYTHIIGSHTKANKVFSDTDLGGSIFSLIYQSGLSYEPIYIIATLAAIIYLLIKRQQINWAIAPLLWLFFNMVRFATISPVWPTYYVYLIFPAAWLVALFLENFLNPKSLSQLSKNLNYFTLIGLGTALLIILQAAFNSVRIAAPRHPTLTQFKRWVQKNTTPHPVEKILASYQNSNKIIITDHAYYTHKFGLNTLPEMAIISRKRLDTEGIDGQDILEAIQKSKADLVFLYRFGEQFLQSPALTQYLRDNFIEYSFKEEKGKLYVNTLSGAENF